MAALASPGVVSQRGALTSNDVIARVLQRARQIEDPLDLSLGQPAVDVPLPIKEAAVEAIQQGQNSYAPPRGHPPLRQRLRQALTDECGRDVGDVVITNGLTGGLVLSLFASTDPGDEVILLDPYFALYPKAIQLLGLRAVAVDSYPDFRLPAAAVRSAVTPRTRVLLLNSPNNPTGAVFTAAEVEAACRIAREFGLIIISDEIYEPFVHERRDVAPGSRSFASPFQSYEHTIVLRGFSKSHAMTGWRIGYAAGPAELIDAMAGVQQYLYGCAPTPFQHAALRALGHGMTEYQATCRRNRDIAEELLEGVLRFQRSQGGFYLFAELPAGLSGTQFTDLALERRVVVFPGSPFSGRDTHVRLSYCGDTQRLVEACGVLRGMLTKPPPVHLHAHC